MKSVWPLLLILLFLALGILAGRTRLMRRGKTATYLLDVCLYALLFSMGLRIGESDAIRTQIGRVGLIAAASAAATVIGTALAVGAAMTVAGRGAEAPPRRARLEATRGNAVVAVMVHLRDPFRLFAAVVAGFLIGYLFPFTTEATVARVTTYLLYLLILLIGFQLARTGVDLRGALLRRRTLLVPAATVVGTLAGGLLLAPLLSLRVGRALSIAAGFGWYSLSGVLITNLGDPVLGSAAFIANMLREGLSLLLIPLLGRAQLGEVAVGIAGATSMDVTLPLIGRSCGTAFVPLAVASGAILSFLVPILVPLLYRL